MPTGDPPQAFITFDPMVVALENIGRRLLGAEKELAAATSRVERAEAAIQRVRELLTDRQSGKFWYVRVADVLAALDSTDPVEDAPPGLREQLIDEQARIDLAYVERGLRPPSQPPSAQLPEERSDEEPKTSDDALPAIDLGTGNPCTIYVPPEYCSAPWVCRVHRGAYPDVPAPGRSGEEFTEDDWVLVDVGPVTQQRGQVVQIVRADDGSVWEYDVRVRDGEIVAAQPAHVHPDYTRSDSGLPVDGETT